MSLIRRRMDFMEPYDYCNYFYSPPSLFFSETSILAPPKTLTSTEGIDLLCPDLDALDYFFLETTPSSFKRIHHRVAADSYLWTLHDRVSELESKFERLMSSGRRNRKYTWTAEIEGKEADRKYKWEAEIKHGKDKKKKHGHGHVHGHGHGHGHGLGLGHGHGHGLGHGHGHGHGHGKVKSCKWTAEIKEKGEEGGVKKTYTWKQELSDDEVESSGWEHEEEEGEEHKKHKKKEEEKKEKGKEKGVKITRLVEIEEPEEDDHRTVVLRQAFEKRAQGARKSKGKKKELSPQDAAMMIQMNYRAYLVRRSQALRALRELAVAKTKLKEIRVLFNNFSYRRRIARDAEERQRFSEKIIVLLLTIDAIEGGDLMVRSSKKSMIDELEAMLDVVDPQPPGKSLSMKRRTFDVPDGVIRKEIAEGVTQIVRMLEEEREESSADTSDA